jgi:putative ABC transport system ATP-binding protein
MLTMSEVSYKYASSSSTTLVLDQVSINFSPGTFYTIFGPSGSGKTTCLSLLGGLDIPTNGTISLDGLNIRKIGYNNLRKNHVAYVFQDFHLFTYMTAIENVMLAMRVTNTYSNKKVARQRAIAILESLGIDTKDLYRVISKLSGGQQQRVAIARALATNATYILADEPTGNLDKNNSTNIIQLLRNLVSNHNKCVITVTHSDEIKIASDICYTIINGKLEQKDLHESDSYAILQK